MTWINFVPFREATGRLETLYDKYRRPNDSLPNIISAHSLRPHLLEGHMVLYRAVLGHSGNTLPLWFLEAIGFYVSVLNKCAYCMDHHSHYGRLAYTGPAREWDDLAAALTEQSIQDLRDAGADDGEILEANQIAGYFAYANRVVLGLGVTLDGEVHTVPKD